ncbi:DUF92 domain-containing protein [Halogeometricum sp. S1BR25-6]|uniref:DUF92 domain-containing protein n=1 Tax=Halogeometricum salsisoli TaxID=2950536 RepID=A0ABU2GG03_9EURY|nr:DUF92 domain-containing protein [Halogeometricum sp. S1BR25-6]MDS0299715.1 DUF92 domain-containing protein [Halogeometricum sp. S1BR25-6]
MQSTLRRAGGFAAVGTLALAAPVLEAAAFAPFAAVALLAAFVVDDGPLFEVFARPGDHQDGRLNGLAGFALAAAGLAILVAAMDMPVALFVATVLVISYGNLGKQAVAAVSDDPFLGTSGFVVGGFLGGLAGQFGGRLVRESAPPLVSLWPSLPLFVFLASAAAIVAALFREMLFERDDPLVMLSTGLLLWLFDALAGPVGAVEIVGALALTIALGYVSYALEAASVAGMLSGVLFSLLVIVFGGFGWFAVLMAFFAIGALSTKFRYEEKRDRGVAEENDGARGTGNVLGNAAVALVAVVGFAASARVPVDGTLFQFAFAGSMAAALSDTLSSEVGGLYDNTRLITTLERVDPGTDGGVTWQGELSGLLGATIVAVVAALLLSAVTAPVGGTIVLLGGLAGMTADSVLGATVEGARIGNEAVNFTATLVGAVVSTGVAFLVL